MVVVIARGACITFGGEEKGRQDFGGETEGGDHLEEVEVDGMIIINRPSRTEMEGFSLGQRFSNCGPRTTSGPRVLPLWSS
jgi:hypothetical protein